MENQIKNYTNDMEKVYFEIMKKYVDKGFLEDIDVLFLKAYKRTVDKNIEIPNI